MADPQIHARGNADQEGDGDVDVGQVDGAIAIEEQRVARRLAGHAAGHGQEQVSEQRKGPSEFTAAQAQHAFSKTQHQALREFTLG